MSDTATAETITERYARPGLFNKFYVNRVDGRDSQGGDREEADYFVLDLTFDPFAKEAVRAYANACKVEYPVLAENLYHKWLHDGLTDPEHKAPYWNPWCKVCTLNDDVDHDTTNVERAKRGLPVPWTPEYADDDLASLPIY